MKRFLVVFIVLALVLSSLSACGKGTFEDGYAAGYNDGYRAAIEATEDKHISFGDWSNAKHATEATVSVLTAKPLPVSGTILSGQNYDGSKITVTADSDFSYVVSLRTFTGDERLSFFVRAGDTVTVGVPSQHLYVYFASGFTWYGHGEGLMFGENTIYSKDDELLDFAQHSWEYTLYPVYDGNFSETPINESEFFG